MTYDPNSDQEQQFLPEMQQDDSMPAPQEDLPADSPVSEDQAVSREEMIQEPDFIGSYADNTIPEGQEPDTGYRGKFAARPSVPPSESSDDFPASEPEQLSAKSRRSGAACIPGWNEWYPASGAAAALPR